MVSGAEESRRKSDKLAEERIGDYSGQCCTRHREDDDEEIEQSEGLHRDGSAEGGTDELCV